MTASTLIRDQLLSDNAKKQGQINELKAFVSRFSANASKAKQASSRAKLIDKIELSEVKASSRVNPFIRFDQDKKLFRLALEVDKVGKTYSDNEGEDNEVLKDLSLMVEVGEKLGVIGANGVGKTTFLKCLVGETEVTSGAVKWSDNVKVGYYGQDHGHDFEEDMSLIDWMSQWKQPSDDEQAVRAVLGRLLFSQKDIDKSVQVISGGEQGRMLFGKLMLQKPNILIMDEPTNHLDMESIESLNQALVDYPGTLIFVSHDREFISSVASRILVMNEDGSHFDFRGDFDSYLAAFPRT
jgi:ATPase subunit of ABC transporter with duplicated ATPase domains